MVGEEYPATILRTRERATACRWTHTPWVQIWGFQVRGDTYEYARREKDRLLAMQPPLSPDQRAEMIRAQDHNRAEFLRLQRDAGISCRFINHYMINRAELFEAGYITQPVGDIEEMVRRANEGLLQEARPDIPGPPPHHCEFCNQWLNGPIQWANHKAGKKHEKR